jgi:acyl-homoserine-lactone acylase
MASSLRCLAIVAAVLCGEAALAAPGGAEIVRTSHGIVHVKADSYRDLGFGLAYAYATDNGCALADQIVTVNGERSRYFSAEGKALVGVETFSNLTSDIFHRIAMDDAVLVRAHRALSPRAADLLRGFVGGYNHYLATTAPSARGTACANAAWVRPMTMRDMRRMIEATALLASGAALAESFAEGTKGPAPVATAVTAAPSPFGLGSNGWAFGREATADGGGLVVANPHFPWNGINRFYQTHLTIPGKLDVMGVMLPPLPLVSIGFSRDVAWTHTVSTAARFTLSELTLEPGDPLAYRVDGKRYALKPHTISVPIRATDGSVAARSFTAYRSIFGPVIASAKIGLGWSGSHAYALHDANRGNVDFIETWLRLATSHSVREMNAALAEKRGIPWVNTIASDRGGDALYADIGRVPGVDAQMSARCRPDGAAALAPAVHVLRGDSRSCDWTGFLPADQMRATIRQDYVLNSNDSYWLVNARDERRALAPILGPTAVPQRFRTRHALLAVDAALAAGTRFTRSTGLDLMLSNRNYSGEFLADDVMTLCKHADTPVDLATACGAIARWDRRSELDSGGSLLFREFWNRARLIPNVFATPFDAHDPLRTPRTLDIASAPVRTALLTALRDAVAALAARGFAPDVTIGNAQRISVNGRLVPVAGGDWYDGVLNLNLTRPVDGVGYEPFDGASYIAAFSFDAAGPVAEGMLVYGQSSDPASPYYFDQLDIYAAKKPYRLPFHRAEILADPAYHPQPIPAR